MDAVPQDWAEAAAARVERRLEARPHWRSPLDRGILLTARTDFRERALAPAFTVRVVQAAGAARRVATAAGAGRPLVILPGLYASLDEGLFADLAELAAARGRPVVLLEDRLAAGTLAVNAGEVPSLQRIGLEVAAVARELGGPPDALALSAGAAAALAAPPGTFARIAIFSGALDLWATAENLARHPLPRFHYRQVHRRAFEGAGLQAPPLSAIPAALAAGAPCGLPPDPLLVVHAEDDPVVPAAVVRSLALEDGQRALILPAGAHLGFGTLAGTDVYLTPFDEGRD
ncbi:MAG TPA: hypothetical protein VMT77_02485 [Gemmatimonadales bacterium]|nr:hypothetical protein [Gemmatimonadales bacterium]